MLKLLCSGESLPLVERERERGGGGGFFLLSRENQRISSSCSSRPSLDLENPRLAPNSMLSRACPDEFPRGLGLGGVSWWSPPTFSDPVRSLYIRPTSKLTYLPRVRVLLEGDSWGEGTPECGGGLVATVLLEGEPFGGGKGGEWCPPGGLRTSGFC